MHAHTNVPTSLLLSISLQSLVNLDSFVSKLRIKVKWVSLGQMDEICFDVWTQKTRALPTESGREQLEACYSAINTVPTPFSRHLDDDIQTSIRNQTRAGHDGRQALQDVRVRMWLHACSRSSLCICLDWEGIFPTERYWSSLFTLLIAFMYTWLLGSKRYDRAVCTYPRYSSKSRALGEDGPGDYTVRVREKDTLKEFVCVCACECVSACTYIYMCVCVCMCVWVWRCQDSDVLF